MTKKSDKNNSFIDALTQDLRPVKPLLATNLQTIIWLLSAVAIVTLMVFIHGLRFDVGEKINNINFLFESSALMLMALIIAYAGFRLGVPDASRRHRLWGALIYGGLIFWIVMFGYNIYHGFEGAFLHTHDHQAHSHYGKFCSATIVASALAAAAVMFFMLRRSFALRPILTGLAVGLTSSTIAYVGGMYFCSIEGGLHIALWHMLPVLLISLILSFFGQAILKK